MDYNYTSDYCSYLFDKIMKKINLAITGCSGRMGKQLIKSSSSSKYFKLVTLTENKKKKKILGILPELNTINAFKKANVIIDFTIPTCTMEVLKIASKLRKSSNWHNWFYKQPGENYKKLLKKISILKAGNMSLGVNLLMYLTEIASKSLGDSFLSKVYEVHHKHKKDFPSGTALMLGSVLLPKK